jgi:DNA mismatch repair ATPase MutS
LIDLLPPSQEYNERIRAREAIVAHHTTVHIRLGNVRLLLAISAVVIGWASLIKHSIPIWWLLAPLVVFIGVAAYHTKVLRALACAQRAVAYYRNGLARIEDKWAGRSETGERFLDPHHIYAADLDLFGKSSLFELLSTGRTRIGEETLAAWLLAPSALEVIRDRHAAISELRRLLDLREDLAVAGEDARVGVKPAELIKWAESSPQLQSAWLRVIAPALALLAGASVLVWIAWDTYLPLLIVVTVEAGIVYFVRRRLDEILHKAEHVFENLGLLSALLARVESERFQAPLLQSLRKKFFSESNDAANSASHAVRRLQGITERIRSRENKFFQIMDVPLMYSVQVALAAETWRGKHGNSVRGWLAAIGEMEALVSLATYSYEHPADPFPEFVSGAARFESEQLAHPLIPQRACVRNDVKVGHPSRVLLVSGSNMSGKSTLLRSVGINTVLAMAGAPVRAHHMRLTALHVGASIKINDSLQEGSSRFYAEITRLRQIVDLTVGELPVMFLLDEVLQGTNSSDRRVGTEGIVSGFLKRGAIGLLSTHDLALTEICGPQADDIKNMHFQDEIKDGQMKFDYVLREGIVTKSNGLELMRSIGLEV